MDSRAARYAHTMASGEPANGSSARVQSGHRHGLYRAGKVQCIPHPHAALTWLPGWHCGALQRGTGRSQPRVQQLRRHAALSLNAWSRGLHAVEDDPCCPDLVAQQSSDGVALQALCCSIPQRFGAAAQHKPGALLQESAWVHWKGASAGTQAAHGEVATGRHLLHWCPTSHTAVLLELGIQRCQPLGKEGERPAAQK